MTSLPFTWREGVKFPLLAPCHNTHTRTRDAVGFFRREPPSGGGADPKAFREGSRSPHLGSPLGRHEHSAGRERIAKPVRLNKRAGSPRFAVAPAVARYPLSPLCQRGYRFAWHGSARLLRCDPPEETRQSPAWRSAQRVSLDGDAAAGPRAPPAARASAPFSGR